MIMNYTKNTQSYLQVKKKNSILKKYEGFILNLTENLIRIFIRAPRFTHDITLYRTMTNINIPTVGENLYGRV